MKRLDKMDIHSIKSMYREGMSQKEIAYIMEISQSAVSRILGGDRGLEIDRMADRMERLVGGISTGCYVNGEEQIAFTDPTADAAEAAIEMEELMADYIKNDDM